MSIRQLFVVGQSTSLHNLVVGKNTVESGVFISISLTFQATGKENTVFKTSHGDSKNDQSLS